MDLREFVNPSGMFVKNHEGYDTFLPHPLPPNLYWDDELSISLQQTNTHLSELPFGPADCPSPHFKWQEAHQILNSSPSRQHVVYSLDSYDLRFYRQFLGTAEADSYLSALESTLHDFKRNGRIDLELIRNMHKYVMQNGGFNIGNDVGKFRIGQNWTEFNHDIRASTYVPPRIEDVENALSEMLNFIGQPESEMPVLVKCALIHYQFLAIHPFADGNGRVGLLLDQIFLYSQGIPSYPLINLRHYLKLNRNEYHLTLQRVARSSKWKQWILFFMRAMRNEY